MPLQTFNISDHVSIEQIFSFCSERRIASPHYANVCDKRVFDAYQKARKYNLRYNRKTNILRDNRLGVLSRPSSPSDWPEATPDETREYLCREVWCDAVAQYNRDHM